MQRFFKRYLLWIAYAAFLICAALFGSREGLVTTQSDHPVAKGMLLILYLSFLAFSLHATRRENFFRSIATVNRLLWGRQVILDLYISVCLSLALIYVVEGSVVVMLLWLVPIIIYANLAILPYLLFNFAEVVGHFSM